MHRHRAELAESSGCGWEGEVEVKDGLVPLQEHGIHVTVNGRRRRKHNYTTSSLCGRPRRWADAASRAHGCTHRAYIWRGGGPRVRNSWTHNSFRIDCYGCPSRVPSFARAIYLTSILSRKARCACVAAAHASRTRSRLPPAPVRLCLPPSSLRLHFCVLLSHFNAPAVRDIL